MVSLVRETVLSNGWLTENEFLNFIAVSESTPGPLAVNMATFIAVSYTHLEDFVWGEGYGNGSKADDERCNMMIGGLNSLIHFADRCV